MNETYRWSRFFLDDNTFGKYSHKSVIIPNEDDSSVFYDYELDRVNNLKYVEINKADYKFYSF